MKKCYSIKTLGCKANIFDSQELEKIFYQQGWQPASLDQIPDIYVINSCAVTQEAEKQTLKEAKKYKKKYPQTKIVVTGCAAEVHPSAWVLPEVDFVVGNQNKPRLVEMVEKNYSSSQTQILGTVADYQSYLSVHPIDREWPAVSDAFFTHQMPSASWITKKTRAFIKIQEGCNAFCTYCIIPYARGPARSLPIKQVVKTVQNCVEQGFLEVVLTGTNIGEYGSDLSDSDTLETLIKSLLMDTDIQRIRLSSLNPKEITPALIQLTFENKRVCKHFHISLQSPLNKILRLMKRKYQQIDIQRCLASLSEYPHLFIGMDIITGFPSETEADFEATVDFLENHPWSRLHVFPYSDRAKTPATKISHKVENDIKARRLRILNSISLNRQKDFYQKILQACQTSSGVLEDVLMECVQSKKSHCFSGTTSNYLKVLIPSQEVLAKVVRAIPIDLIVDSQKNEVAFLAKVSQ